MSTPALEVVLNKLKELSADPTNRIVIAPPIAPGSMTWLKERFETKLERPLPADLATFLETTDGCEIKDAVLLAGRGPHGLVDHNLELRVPPGRWTKNQIVIGSVGGLHSYVLDADSGQCHTAELLQPKLFKTFASFPALMVHILKEQLGVRARGL
jgi:hypothetical protein